MPLAAVKAGSRVHLVSIDAGECLQCRLASMGLIPGVEIEVIRNSMRGPFLVSVKNSRIALGRGMVQKIMVA